MKNKLPVFAALILLIGPAISQAVPILTTDRTTFESMGDIAFNYGFEDFPTNDFSFPGDPWYASGVTYTTGSNLIVGAGAGTIYNVLSNVFTFNGWSPVTGDIDAGYDLFGFDLGVGNSGGLTTPLDITIFTTTGAYSWLNQIVPNASEGFQFFGFSTAPGETFLGFSISSGGAPYFPALDNVTLGNQVPEPGSLLLLSIGLLALGLMRRRVSHQPAAR